LTYLFSAGLAVMLFAGWVARGGMAAVAAGGGGRGALLLYLSHAFAFAA
jgi:hypothetical protein